MSKYSVFGELWVYLRQQRKTWLLPIVMTLLLIGGLMVFASSSAFAPFIYTLF
jgi:hypothetical protein